MVRLAHISDMHLTAATLGWQMRDFLSKRVSSWLNLRLRRGRRFARADDVLARLAQDFDERGVDHVIFSGDATALGFESEMRRVAEILGVDRRAGLAVPGNHDYCTMWAAQSGAFENCFAPWQLGERLDNEVYPFAQRVGHVWLVGVNSARGNFWFWDASGNVGAPQRQRLARLLEKLTPGPRILVTHYPVCLADCSPEDYAHGLRDLNEVVAVAAEHDVALWLHGHRHAFYHVQSPPAVPFSVICAGSSTQHGLWSYGEYVIDGAALYGTRRVFDPELDRFRDAESFELHLKGVVAGA
jgi:3',5'-cyclic AMP phosphodiesterase CpdA